MTSLDVTNMTFQDPKTSFLLSALNDCGNLNLTVVYSRLNIKTVETESMDWDVSQIIYWCRLLVIAGAAVAIKFFLERQMLSQKPAGQVYSVPDQKLYF
jgi:hypothetical protein